MWISKKKWVGLEKRIADLEKEGRQHKTSPLSQMKAALREVLPSDVHQVTESERLATDLLPTEPL